MKHYPVRPVLFLFITTLVFSCSKTECTNANPVFDMYAPEKKIYKDELVKQLRIAADPVYRFDSYTEINGVPYLYVDVTGDGLCAKGVIASSGA